MAKPLRGRNEPDFGEITKSLNRLDDDTAKGVEDIMEGHAPLVQGYAQQNAPWTDRTGNARQGLTAQAFVNEDNHAGVELFHQMPYGVFLETRWGGKYQIIAPTMSRMGKQIIGQVRNLLGKI